MLVLIMGCLTSPWEHRALQIIAGDADGDGYAHERYSYGLDCDDEDPNVNPGVVEVPYNGVDDDCDPRTPDDDFDSDGYKGADDCDDFDSSLNPGMVEVWYDGIDQNCDGNDSDADFDGADSVAIGGQDCDDQDTAVQMRHWYLDVDEDGYGDQDVIRAQCEAPPGFVEIGGDCDDARVAVNPGASEVCDDGLDNDCSGGAPECYIPDGQTFASEASARYHGNAAADGFGSGLALGDINGDGQADLLVGAPGSGCAYLNLAGRSQVELCHGVVGLEFVAIISDLDGDGGAELAVSGQDGVVTLLSGTAAGGGKMGEVSTISLVGSPGGRWTGLKAMDPSLGLGEVVSLQHDSIVKDSVNGHVWTGDGFDDDWALSLGLETNNRPLMAVLDSNADGQAEIAVGVQRSDRIEQIFVFTPIAGVFQGASEASGIGARNESVTGLAAGDYDGDGYGDLLVGLDATGAEGGSVALLLGPEIPNNVERADGTVIGLSPELLGAGLCVVQFAEADHLVIVGGIAPDGVLSGLEVPLSGKGLANPVWTLTGEAGGAGGRIVVCGDATGTSAGLAGVSEFFDSETQSGQVTLFDLHQI